MIKNKKTMILTAVMMTAALGVSQAAFADETEAPTESTLSFAQETTEVSRPHPIVRNLIVTDDNYNDPEDYTTYTLYAQLQYPRVYLLPDEADAFPELSQGLNDYYDKLEAEKLKAFDECKEAAHERYDMMEQDGQLQYWGNFTNDESAAIVRADSRVLSVRDDFYSYEGGAHGYYSRYGVTFDTQTGKQLAFTDVVTDPAAAAKYTFEKLNARYPELEPLMTPEEVADFYQEDNSSFSWTLEPAGMMIYFPPYMLASYAEGMQAVLLPYEEYPDLFAPEYVSDTDEWIVPLDSLFGVLTDPGTGISEITVSGTQDDYGYTDRIITVDNKPSSFGKDSLDYYNSKSYLISSGGKLWLWCLDSVDNDYQNLHIYGFEDKRPFDTEYSELLGSTVIEATWGEDLSYSDSTTLTDPAKVSLVKRMNVLGTFGASKEYFVSGGGTPVSEDLFYTPDSVRTLTLKVPLTLKMVGQDGNGETMKEWPAGTTCTILRTDGNQIVDLVMDNDETQVARIASDFSSWPHQISGMDEEDVFDGVMYAG